ncbi:hypothetical protein SAMD00023353_1100530 [Rosellinia necatrix]|uniref:Uncharacterized protein n=1 Tax=Rosellinia necatrix TaxID=77044 RepID=A0A1S7UMG6_ROSNE|nr:hypothetical protein SAMD00023353_1100530 [Rosellinia necatrix]
MTPDDPPFHDYRIHDASVQPSRLPRLPRPGLPMASPELDHDRSLSNVGGEGNGATDVDRLADRFQSLRRYFHHGDHGEEESERKQETSRFRHGDESSLWPPQMPTPPSPPAAPAAAAPAAAAPAAPAAAPPLPPSEHIPALDLTLDLTPDLTPDLAPDSTPDIIPDFSAYRYRYPPMMMPSPWAPQPFNQCPADSPMLDAPLENKPVPRPSDAKRPRRVTETRLHKNASSIRRQGLMAVMVEDGKQCNVQSPTPPLPTRASWTPTPPPLSMHIIESQDGADSHLLPGPMQLEVDTGSSGADEEITLPEITISHFGRGRRGVQEYEKESTPHPTKTQDEGGWLVRRVRFHATFKATVKAAFDAAFNAAFNATSQANFQAAFQTIFQVTFQVTFEVTFQDNSMIVFISFSLFSVIFNIPRAGRAGVTVGRVTRVIASQPAS